MHTIIIIIVIYIMMISQQECPLLALESWRPPKCNWGPVFNI